MTISDPIDRRSCTASQAVSWKRRLKAINIMLGSALISCAVSAQAQPTPGTDPDPSATAQPVDRTTHAQGPDDDVTKPGDKAVVDAEPDKAIPTAEVIEVGGSVEQAEPDVSPLVDAGWTPVQVGDRLAPGTQLRTGLRSHVNLRFGETTVVSVRSATHASVDAFYRSATSETVRIGLGYGTVRGSSSEGELRSDVTVDSTVATLAKRGTEGWEMSVEPMTGRFRISLARSGLVEAIRKLQNGRTVSRTVAPGEYATRSNIANMWIAQAVFDRNVTFYEASSVTAADAEFETYNTGGFGSVAPGGGSQLADVGGRIDARALVRQAAINNAAISSSSTTVVQPGLLARPEGHFGTPDTFRILLPQGRRRTPMRSVMPVPHSQRHKSR